MTMAFLAAAGTFFLKMAATYAISYILQPKTHTEGPKMTDLSVQGSVYGTPIRDCWGSVRLAGNIIWSEGIKEHKHEEDVGKGGASYTSYSYTCSFAVAICKGEIEGIRRIWADSKLIYDRRDLSGVSISAYGIDLNMAKSASVTFYPGSETQEADPIIEAVEGAGEVPGYRGLCYIVFEDMQLADFANRIPNLEFEVADASDSDYYGVRIPYPLEAAQGAWSPGMTIREYGFLLTTQHWCHPTTPNGYVYSAISGGGGTAGMTEPTWPTTLGETVEDGDAVWVCYSYHDTRFTAGKTPSLQRLREVDGGILVCVQDGGTYSDPAYLQRWAGIPDPYGNGAKLMWNVNINDADVGGHFEENCTLTNQLNHIMVMFTEWGFNETCFNVINTYPPETCNIEEVIRLGYPSMPWCSFYRGRTATGTGHYKYYFETGNGSKIQRWVCEETSYPSYSCTLMMERDLGASYSNIHIIDDGIAIATKGSCKVVFEYDLYSSTVVSNEVEGPGASYMPGQAIYFDNNVLGVGSYADAVPTGMGYITMALCGPWSITPMEYDLFTGSSMAVDQMVADILENCGLTSDQYDVTDLSGDTAIGFVRTGVMSGEELLKPLMRVFQFDIVEQDWKVVCKKRGGSVVANIPWGDLAAHEQGGQQPEAIIEKIEDESSLPLKIVLEYRDFDADYMPAIESATRSKSAVNTDNIKTLEYPIVMQATKALQAVETLFETMWVQRKKYQIAIPTDYIKLSPGDLITIDSTYKVLISKVDVSFPLILKIEAAAEDTASYTSNSISVAPFIVSQNIGKPAFSYPVFLDLPSLIGYKDELSFYFGAYAIEEGWKTTLLYRSIDDGQTWEHINAIENMLTVGTVSNELADGPVTVVDEGNSMTVVLSSYGKTLAGATLESVFSGTNNAAVGTSGRWEIVGFSGVVQNADGSYTLTNLVRGRKGTDHNTANHKANDAFILLEESKLLLQTIPDSQLDTEIKYRMAPIGVSLLSGMAFEFTCIGNVLAPFSPVDIQGERDSSGNLTISWVRRSRSSIGWSGTGAPMLENTEEYEIDVYSGATIKRTIEVSSATSVIYTAAQQTTDFGSTQASVKVIVYQISDTVGRGTGREATI